MPLARPCAGPSTTRLPLRGTETCVSGAGSHDKVVADIAPPMPEISGFCVSAIGVPSDSTLQHMPEISAFCVSATLHRNLWKNGWDLRSWWVMIVA